MQYYNEEKMHNLRLLIEKEVLNWPNVTTKKSMVVRVTKIRKNYSHFWLRTAWFLQIRLSKEFTIKPFQAGKRKMNKWPQVSVDETTDVEKIIPFMKNSYDQSQTST
jgi:hypothetical protein